MNPLGTMLNTKPLQNPKPPHPHLPPKTHPPPSPPPIPPVLRLHRPQDLQGPRPAAAPHRRLDAAPPAPVEVWRGEHVEKKKKNAGKKKPKRVARAWNIDVEKTRGRSVGNAGKRGKTRENTWKERGKSAERTQKLRTPSVAKKLEEAREKRRKTRNVPTHWWQKAREPRPPGFSAEGIYRPTANRRQAVPLQPWRVVNLRWGHHIPSTVLSLETLADTC